MRLVRRRLTYANVIATLSLFLALGGGAVWAAGRVHGGRLRPNSVSAGKIKRNAITAAKIRPNAVTAAKIRPGAVSFEKLATGANLIASAQGGPVPAFSSGPIDVPLTGTVTFTPTAGTLDLLSVELKGEGLGRVGAEPCEPVAIPFVNGSRWDGAGEKLGVGAFAPTPEQPSGLIPLDGGTAPVGLTSPGVSQTVSMRVVGDPRCTGSSRVSVAIAVTQAK
jgi:hypothetical protein